MNSPTPSHATSVSKPHVAFSNVGLVLLVLIPAMVVLSCGTNESADSSVVDESSASSETASNMSSKHQKGPLTTSVEHLQVAVDSDDFCSVYEAIDIIDLSISDWSKVAGLMHSISESMVASEEFVPEEIHDNWVLMTEGIRRIEDELAKPDFEAEALRALTATPDLVEADRAVGEWTDENC